MSIINNRLFGTSGIRGIAGEELSEALCRGAGRAAGSLLPAGSRICIATDTRISRELIKNAVTAGLRESGIDVTDLGILPTPALAFLTRDMGFDTGIMITASHNPPEFNGIKFFNSDTIGYSREQEQAIEEVYNTGNFRNEGYGSLVVDTEAGNRYLEFMEHRFPQSSFDHSFRIVVDAGNGAASGFAGDIFSRLGFDVLRINDEPDGRFPGRKPEPKEDTLRNTLAFLREQKAELAVCFDGDADRVVFMDKDGFIGFNEMITFISGLTVKDTGKKKVAATIETGKMIDLLLNKMGVDVVRGKVGDVYAARLAREIDAAIGVEPIGVYIMPEIGYYPDSIFAALYLLSHIGNVREIRDFFEDMPSLFLGQERIPCNNSAKTAIMVNIMEQADNFGANTVNTLDGVRLEFDNAWLLIRASGTEPLIRVIAEAETEVEMKSLLKKGTAVLNTVMDN